MFNDSDDFNKKGVSLFKYKVTFDIKQRFGEGYLS